MNSRIWSLPGVCFLYTLILVVFFYPYINDISTKIIGGQQDSFQDFWNTWYFASNFFSGSGEFFHTKKIYYPEGTSLLHHSFAYTNAFIVYVIIKIFSLPSDVNVLLTLHNFTLLLSYFLAGIGAYLLCRKLTNNNFASFIAGFIFAFSPFHHAHFLSHMHVATIQYIPFFVYFFIRSIEHPKTLNLFGAIVFCVLGALSSWYYLIYNLLFLGIYSFWFAFNRKILFPTKPLIVSVLVSAGTILFLAPLIIPMGFEAMSSSRIHGSTNSSAIVDISALMVFYPLHWLYFLVEPYDFALHNQFKNKVAYLGLVNISILVWYWIRSTQKYKDQTSLAIWISVFFLCWSFGTWVHFFGFKLPIPMPHLVSQDIPILENLRGPARALVYVYLFFGILVGIAVSHFVNSRAGKIIPSLIVLLIVLDFYPAKMLQQKIELPDAYKSIVQENKDESGVLEIPFSHLQGKRHMMYQTFHGMNIVSGATSKKANESLIETINWKSLVGQREQLRENKVEYIVIDKSKKALLGKYLYKNGIGVRDYKAFYKPLFEGPELVVLKVE